MIIFMNKSDILYVDGRLLSVFAAVASEGSVTRAAERLNVSQSSVSHALNRLREVFGDPLFVRAGRSIAPTEHALALAPRIHEVLEQLASLAEPSVFDSMSIDTRFVLSINDYERELLAPRLVSLLMERAPNARLKFIDTRGDVVDSLRTRACDMVVTPLKLPETYDIHTRDFFEDSYLCFFDSKVLSAQNVMDDYLGMRHVKVQYSRGEPSYIDELLRSKELQRNVVIEAPSCALVAQIMRGTSLVATLLSRSGETLFAGFGSCECPLKRSPLEFRMVWHRTTHHSQKYHWFRSLVHEAIS